MKGTIFISTLRQNGLTALYWGLGLALIAYFIIIVIPDVEALNQYASMVESLPPVLMQSLGIEDAASIATPEGYISFGYFTYALMIFAIYALFNGLAITANEEDEGLLDLLLSLPLPRWQLVTERFAAYALLLIFVVLLGFGGLWAGLLTSPLEVSLERLFIASINLIPPLLLVMALTFFLTALLPRGQALAWSAGFIISSYLLTAITGTLGDSAMAQAGRLSFFSYNNVNTVIQDGIILSEFVGMLLVAGVFLVIGLVIFQRRDIRQ
jgi:ABC-2 type transport system permease protein